MDRRYDDATPDRIKTLPVWARGYINWLQMKLNEADAAFEKVAVRAEPNRDEGIVINPYSENAYVVPLDTRLRLWVFPRKFAIDIHAGDANTREGHIHVSGYGLQGSGSLIVRPNASNALDIGR